MADDFSTNVYTGETFKVGDIVSGLSMHARFEVLEVWAGDMFRIRCIVADDCYDLGEEFNTQAMDYKKPVGAGPTG